MFVTNLPFDFSEKKIKEHFYFSATIQRIEMVKNQENSSYGMCFIKVKDPKEAERLVKKHDKTLVDGRMISVKIADEDL